MTLISDANATAKVFLIFATLCGFSIIIFFCGEEKIKATSSVAAAVASDDPHFVQCAA